MEGMKRLEEILKAALALRPVADLHDTDED
jgi:hypothetical protein